MDVEWKTYKKDGSLKTGSFYQVGDSIGTWMNYEKGNFSQRLDTVK